MNQEIVQNGPLNPLQGLVRHGEPADAAVWL